MHRDRLWQYSGDACADWFKEQPERQGANFPEEASTRQEVLEDTTRSNAASRRTRRRRREPPDSDGMFPLRDETLPLQRGQDNLRRSDRSRRRPLRYSDFVTRCTVQGTRHSVVEKFIKIIFSLSCCYMFPYPGWIII